MRAGAVLGCLAVAAGLVIGAVLLRGDRHDVAEPELVIEADVLGARAPAPMLAAAPRAIARANARGTGVVFGTILDGRPGGRPMSARISAWRTRPFKFGKAIAGAEAAFNPTPRDVTAGPPDIEGVADAAGSYELSGLAAGDYIVSAQVDGDPPLYGEAWAEVEFDGDRTRFDITLASAGLSLVVHARRADGSPWRVRVGVSGSARCAAGDTDDVGAVAFSGLGEGETELDVFSAAEGLRLTATMTLPTKEPFVVTEPTGLVELSGRVIEAAGGAPLAGARVRSDVSLANLEVMTYDESRPDGTFRLRAHPAVGEVGAEADGYVDGKAALRGKATGITIAMRRRSRLTGTVVEAATRTPVPGVRVLAAAAHGDTVRSYRMQWNPLGDGLGTTVTDATGHFAIDVEAVGEVELRALGNGWCSKGLGLQEGGGATTIDVAAGSDTAVTLEVERAARITGLVLDTAGKPAARASVRVVLHATGVRARRHGNTPQAAFPVVSGADGRFVIDAVLPGVEVDLSASLDRVWGPAVTVGALESGGVRDVEVRLALTRTVVVTVVHDADGSPVRQADVTLSGDEDAWNSQTADASGVANFFLVSAAASQIRATTPDPYPPVRMTTERAESGEAVIPAVADSTGPLPSVAITVRVGVQESDEAPVALATISGTVRFPDGTPAVGGSVSVPDEDQTSAYRFGLTAYRSSADVGPDGAFSLEVGVAASVTLHAAVRRLGAAWSATVEAAPGAKGVAITVKERGTDGAIDKIVRVLGPDGTPVATASAQLKFGTKSHTTSTTQQVVDGDLEIDSSAETVEITITDARGIDGARLAVAAFRLGPVAIAQVPAELRLLAEKTIAGFVRSSDGGPVAGVVVSAERAESDAGRSGNSRSSSPMEVAFRRLFQSNAGASNVRSAADGAFRLRGLDDVEYRIVVQVASGFVSDDEQDLRARGGATGVVVTLRPGVDVTIRVVDADGKPVAGATADAMRAGPADDGSRRALGRFRRHLARMGTAGTGVTDSNGTVRLTGLDAAATYTLEIDPPDERTDVQSRQVDAWKPAGDTIRLDRSRSTRGIVRSPTGEVLAGATVHWKLGATGDSLTTDDDGAFSIEHSDAGEITFTASYSSEGEPAKLRATAGAQDVVIVLDPGAELSVRFDPAEPAPDEIYIVREGVESTAEVTQNVAQHVLRAGVCRFRGLRADGTYAVWVTSRRRPLVGLLTGLRPSREPVTMRRVPGRTISVRVSGPDGLELDDFRVVARRGPVYRQTWTGTQQALTIDGLMEGRWRVRVTASIGEDEYQGEADAEAGGDVEIRLSPVNR